MGWTLTAMHLRQAQVSSQLQHMPGIRLGWRLSVFILYRDPGTIPARDHIIRLSHEAPFFVDQRTRELLEQCAIGKNYSPSWYSGTSAEHHSPKGSHKADYQEYQKQAVHLITWIK